MICKNELTSLLETSYAYVICEEEAKNVESLFLKTVENKQDKASFFMNKLNDIKDILKVDLQFFMDSDPAAKSLEEIKLAYPGYKAIAIYRISHILNQMGYEVISRIFSEIAHGETGIDIHPACKIDYPFFIDHGTGIVIGETASIGKRVKLYQSVTLGALSLSNAAALRGVIRHPQIGNDVTIYAGASLLGNIKIGDNVTIGGNVFLMKDVAPNMRVTIGEPVLVIKSK